MQAAVHACDVRGTKCSLDSSSRSVLVLESRFTMRNDTQNAKINVAPIRFEDLEDGEDLKMKIARRAYQIFERRGKVSGHDVDDWLKAESEVHFELH